MSDNTNNFLPLRTAVFCLLFVSLLLIHEAKGQNIKRQAPDVAGFNEAKPWVLWYWMEASVSKAGIRADLVAMKQQGIAGAYLVCIKGKPDSLLIDPPVVQLTPIWWQMVKYAFTIADSLGLKLGMHIGDGFATSGGPWITPDLSMQRIVWSDTSITGGRTVQLTLPKSKDIKAGYYQDIAVYAFPAQKGAEGAPEQVKPVVTSSVKGQDPGVLINADNTINFSSKEPCWIDFAYKEPFTCRTIEIRTKGITFQAKRLRIFISDNGRDYRFYTQLEPARSGWQDYSLPVYYSIAAVSSKYFRFVYDPAGTEPGSEDLDDAKWSPSLKLTGLILSSRARIPHFLGKSGAIWRIAKRADTALIPDRDCITVDSVINITSFLQSDGKLKWRPPPGKWTILRMGHSSTGSINSTAGGAKGLESDKFNPKAVKLQYDSWFGQAIKKLGPELAGNVLRVFYMDSWECGSQNWSPVFRQEFLKRRGYDPIQYLPVMAGYPIGSGSLSEKFLYDVRLTISELLNENYFGTLQQLAHQGGYQIAAEATAPVMVGDGMRHFDKVDFPMGEFWLRSPTHDKPNDILDAISGAHIYGKSVVQSEAFTELRNKWDEYPGMLKALQDHHYAMGINRLVFHVFGENPWLDRAPGMTLGGVGLYFQRNQTWWPMVRGWMDYTRRTQALLQQGTPVTDIAVFNGMEIPSRSVLPDRLIKTLPGLFGAGRILAEKVRLENKGNPLQHIPEKVTSSAGITTAKDWVDPLNGYKYDAVNADALVRLAHMNAQGGVLFGGDNSYSVLIVPDLEKMDPDSPFMTLDVARALLRLTKAGATLIMDRYPRYLSGLEAEGRSVDSLHKVIEELLGSASFFKVHRDKDYIRSVGKGRVFLGDYGQPDLSLLDISKDFKVTDAIGRQTKGVAWNHRKINPQMIGERLASANPDVPDLKKLGVSDIYFVSNQSTEEKLISVSLRVSGKRPLLYNAVTGTLTNASEWSTNKQRTELTLRLPVSGSLFILLKDVDNEKNASGKAESVTGLSNDPSGVQDLKGPWQVQFDPAYGGPVRPVAFDTLYDWRTSVLDSIRYYSGIASYKMRFDWSSGKAISGAVNQRILLDLGQVQNIASVLLNGKDCGVAWTMPYQLDITKNLKEGENVLEIKVANTWANRILRDEALPVNERQTWTTCPFNLQGDTLLSAGLLGPVQLIPVNKDRAVDN